MSSNAQPAITEVEKPEQALALRFEMGVVELPLLSQVASQVMA